MASEAQRRAVAKYDAARTRQIKIKLNLIWDADILRKLESVDKKQTYIKDLIRQDISKEPE